MNIISIADFKKKNTNYYNGGGEYLKILHTERAKIIKKYINCTDEAEKGKLLQEVNRIDKKIIPLEIEYNG